MSSISVELSGETQELLKRLKYLSNVDKRGVMQSVAETLRSSTIERFDRQTEPSGKKWKPSIRAQSEGGKTLTKSALLKQSIHAQADSSGASIGTNDIRAATLQFGDKRTIRPKNGSCLTFKINGRFVSTKQVEIDIPARAFIGISESDNREIKAMFDELIGGILK